jgi:hypothetical protein
MAREKIRCPGRARGACQSADSAKIRNQIATWPCLVYLAAEPAVSKQEEGSDSAEDERGRLGAGWDQPGVSLLASRDRRLKTLQQGVQPDNAPGISCKRKEILRLTLQEYQKQGTPLTTAFERAAKFLSSLRFYAARDLPAMAWITRCVNFYKFVCLHMIVRSLIRYPEKLVGWQQAIEQKRTC